MLAPCFHMFYIFTLVWYFLSKFWLTLCNIFIFYSWSSTHWKMSLSFDFIILHFKEPTCQPSFLKWVHLGTPLPQDWKCFESTLLLKVVYFRNPLPQDWKCFESTLFLSGLFKELPCPRIENVLNVSNFLKWFISGTPLPQDWKCFECFLFLKVVYFRNSLAPGLKMFWIHLISQSGLF